MPDKCRNTIVPLHPDPDKVLAGTNLWVFPNMKDGLTPVVPPVDNLETDVWEDGDGTPITEDPYEVLLLLDY